MKLKGTLRFHFGFCFIKNNETKMNPRLTSDNRKMPRLPPEADRRHFPKFVFPSVKRTSVITNVS